MKRRLLTLFLALALICSVLPHTALPAHAEVYSGDCGTASSGYSNAKWTLDTSTGLLEIKGTGIVGSHPWYEYADSIRNVVICDGITNVPKGMCNQCKNLVSVTIPQSVTEVGERAFCQSSLKNVTLPDGITYIADQAFLECPIKQITLPQKLTQIGDNAFSGCTGLTTVTLPASVTGLGKGAFSGCTNLETITLSNKLQGISSVAFSGCSKLKAITLPSRLTNIGDMAFSNCSGLTSISIPKSVTKIGWIPFLGCTSLRKITVDSGNEYYSSDSSGVLFNKQKTWLLECPGGYQGSYTIPDSVIRMDASAFESCVELTDVTLSWNLTELGDATDGHFFERCDNLTSVKFCPGLTYIGTQSFYRCKNLKSVKIPAGVTTIEEEALGYYWENGSKKKVPGFTIYGKAGSASQKYANKHGFTFVPVVYTEAKITGQPEDVQAHEGDKVRFSVTAEGSDLQYQWQYKTAYDSTWKNWNGATSSSIQTTASVTNDMNSYRCFVFNDMGFAESRWARLTLIYPVSIYVTPEEASADAGKAVQLFRYVHNGTVSDERWQYKKPGMEEWIDWTDKTGSSITLVGSADTNGCQFRFVGNSEGRLIVSNAVLLTVTGLPDMPVISSQPSSVSVGFGENTTFRVSASGKDLKYKWQYRYQGTTNWKTWSGKTEPSLTVTGKDANSGCQYRCVVSNGGGSVYSNAVTLTVIPKITLQPRSNTVAMGAKTSFTVAAAGTNLTYQWQYVHAGATGWKTWAGKTEPTLVVTGKESNNGCRYRCVISGFGSSVRSEEAVLTVDPDHAPCPGAAFTDLPPCDTPEHAAIDWAIEAGVTNGTSSSTFSPDKTVTRGQAVTFLWRACGSPEPTTEENPFTDVKEDSYCYKAVLWANENNVTNGTSATTFSPNRTCSRGHILTFLWRQQGSPAVSEELTVPYADVRAGAFYEAAMKWAWEQGIDRGVSETEFAPNADCTRLSTVLFLYRAVTGQGRLK